ncbi:MAG: PIN domain-containing protein [Bauldia sp.]
MTDKSRVYMDACCFIDAVKAAVGAKLDSDRQKDAWHIKQLLQAHRDGEVEVFTSTLSIAECTHVEGDTSPQVRNHFSALLTSGQYLVLVEATPFIMMDARDLRWGKKVTLRGADAVHVASALERRCEEFITSDKGVGKLNAFPAIRGKLRAVAGRETKCLPDKYRQLDIEDGKKH